MLVMLFGGLWHGSSWNFIIWGTIHGSFLAIERLAGKKSFYSRMPKLFGITFTFIIVLFSWVFFRADDLPNSISYIQSMLGFNLNVQSDIINQIIIYNPYYIFSFFLSAVVVWWFPQTWDFTKKITLQKTIWIMFLMVVSVLALITQDFNPFIYLLLGIFNC